MNNSHRFVCGCAHHGCIDCRHDGEGGYEPGDGVGDVGLGKLEGACDSGGECSLGVGDWNVVDEMQSTRCV